ncbi:hypothetical protein ILUMI_02514 [Ignelater luminosus]|uniref:Uncharacterized protein n=1 Tax=Ignelater luminosus TaxID=2038154 RepID=A0A8K0GN41_IGNLU|nr:hypothetical protein ILUMI_02514 [Ignelater luminosus]
MCLLLIEDVDIVFEQDENFMNALGQLLTTSKRPVILTTADPNCLHLKRFFTQYKIISFNGLSAKVLVVWLQIVCLIEGLCVNKDTLAQLLERNNGDVRHTLLQLQFWVCSGGQLNPKLDQNNSMYIINDNSESTNEENYLFKDDSSNISWLNDEIVEQQKESVTETFVHSNCLESFGYFKNYNELHSSYLLDLGDAWWNLSNLFGITLLPTCNDNVNKSKESADKISELKNIQLPNGEVDNEMDVINLKNVSNIFEVLAVTDVTYKKLNIDHSSEPVQRNRGGKITDSLELNECSEGYNLNRDLANDWCHYLFNGYLNSYKTFPEKSNSFVEEKRWRTKRYKCNEAFREAIPFVCHLDHNSVNMDYLSTLRTMARSEVVRATNNSKRKNRFYNYLRGVGIDCNDSLFKTACDVFHQES